MKRTILAIAMALACVVGQAQINQWKLAEDGSAPVTLPAASHVTVTPETTTSAVADGQALSYNAVVTVPRTNSYLTQVIVSDTETNVPASMKRNNVRLGIFWKL